MGIEVLEVKTNADQKKFIQFPFDLYKDNPLYAGELYVTTKSMITKDNPFFKHSKITLFLAFSGHKTVGRIAVIKNQVHLKLYKDEAGFFGYFDAINNPEVAKALFNKAQNWLKDESLTKIIGPTNLTTNDSCGILINGFKNPNVISMPYNYKYYDTLLTLCGFEKELDLYSYWFDGKQIEQKYGNVLKRCTQSMDKKGITIRPVSKKTFDHDISRLRNVYNACNQNNWGFIPLNEIEFKKMANELKLIAPLELALIAEKGNDIIGFILAVPDLNQAIKHVKNGKLLPFGFLKLLWYKRKINKARVMILGVLKNYSGLGLDLILYHKITKALIQNNVIEAEAGYVLESNNIMNSVLHKIGGIRTKTYRIYNKTI
ncbi:hypothetical protein [Seonamhaeicola maritimus]|uniref:N-acetyltransferase domain-containing protein n=1 Tax=Seonamhaeicola maritimus TaxID=2591822 RepID=A0A5C7GJU5_9FLAO|nr:hypothetical protein [Seonamhaeicola maritimus]TXG38669.1 hypothetical protein FUA22_01950 [Seonamhaeicola maritimus]